jgi:hypothetical protein
MPEPLMALAMAYEELNVLVAVAESGRINCPDATPSHKMEIAKAHVAHTLHVMRISP